MLNFDTQIDANVYIEGKDISASERINGGNIYDIINKTTKCLVMEAINSLCKITNVNITINTK